MSSLSPAETVMNVSKFAIAMDHIKNNRIEYLIVLLLSHMVGLTAKAFEYGQGVCN